MAGFFDWETLTPLQRQGLLSADPPLESPLFSPDDVIGSGLFKGLLGMAISPTGKQALIEALKNGGQTKGFQLGDLTDGQARNASRIVGENISNDITASPSYVKHLYESRVLKDGYSPEEVAGFAEMAMRPVSKVQQSVYPNRFELINRGLSDRTTGRPFDSIMPIDVDNGVSNVVTVIPKGLKSKKK